MPSVRLLTLSKTFSQFFFRKDSFAKNTHKYLSPPFFQTRPPDKLSWAKISSTMTASLFFQFIFAEEFEVKIPRLMFLTKVSISLWLLTIMMTSSAYADSLKAVSQPGKPTPDRSVLSLCSRGSMVGEFSMPDQEPPSRLWKEHSDQHWSYIHWTKSGSWPWNLGWNKRQIEFTVNICVHTFKSLFLIHGNQASVQHQSTRDLQNISN